MQLRLPLAWLISRLWLTNNEPPICIMWPWILRQDPWPFAFQRKNQYRQCATFSTALCICRRHCAVYGRKAGKIICCLRLPQFAVQHHVLSSILKFFENSEWKGGERPPRNDKCHLNKTRKGRIRSRLDTPS